MSTPAATHAVVTFLNDLLDGPGPEGSLVVNRSDPGLLQSLTLLSAEQASAIAPGGRASIAAHVEHLRFGLELLNRWSAGDQDAFETADFSAAWTSTTVSTGEWAARCESLAREAHAWARAVALPPAAATGPGIDVAIASVVHLAYHLGAIRQMHALLRGPAAQRHHPE